MQEDQAKRGHCRACGVTGRGRRDFICEDCGNPNRIIVVCGYCHTRNDATAASLETLCKNNGLAVPETPGVTVKLTRCDECSVKGTEISATLFKVREPSN